MSNAPRSKASVASNRLHHGQAGAGAGSKSSMKRQRPPCLDRDVLSAESVSDAVGERKESLSGGAKSKKRFVGVRQRPSGRWVAEIKDTTQKIRLWLGTFDSAEEGAKAYDSAARALRGANTRTNFVPVMASEGTTAPASKAARLIRLRQMATASKACEKGPDPGIVKVDQPQLKESPALVRPSLQQSISRLEPPAMVDDHAPHLPPPRLIGRRHYAPPQLACPKPEQDEDDVPSPFAAVHDYDTVTAGNGSSSCIKLEVVDPLPPAPKLEPQQSFTAENHLPKVRNHSRIADSPSPLRFPSPRSSPFMDEVQSMNSFVQARDYLKETTRFFPQARVGVNFATFAVDNFVPPVSTNFQGLEASSRQLMVREENTNIELDSGLVPTFPHHQLGSCATNREHTSMYKDEVMSLRSSSSMDGPMSVDDELSKCVTMDHQSERRASVTARCSYEEMDHGAESEIYRVEAAGGSKGNTDRAILREKEFGEIPWADYVLMDETGMNSGLLGLDENSGVYTSPFDFSLEAIERDSCTSVGLEHEHLSGDSEFLLRMQYEQPSSSPSQTFPQGCVLLTNPANSDRSYSTSPDNSILPQPLLSAQETHTLSPQLWQMQDASACCDGQSSGSTETSADFKPSICTTGDAGGECTSQDHDSALWSSMDLPPLCMVA